MDAPDLKSSDRFLPARFLFNGIDLIYTNRYAKSNPGRHVRIGRHRGSLLPLALAHGEQATARRPVHRSPRNPVLPSAIPQIRTTHTKLTMPQSYFTPQFQSPHNADPRSMVLRDLWRPAVLRCEIPGAHAEVTAWRYFYCLLTTSEKGSVQTLMFRPTQRPNPTVARRPQFVVCAFSVARLRRARQGHAKIYIRKEGGGVRILRATEPGRSFELAPTESAATVSRSVRAMRGLLRGKRRS
jgi:hypothetical protein